MRESDSIISRYSSSGPVRQQAPIVRVVVQDEQPRTSSVRVVAREEQPRLSSSNSWTVDQLCDQASSFKGNRIFFLKNFLILLATCRWCQRAQRCQNEERAH